MTFGEPMPPNLHFDFTSGTIVSTRLQGTGEKLLEQFPRMNDPQIKVSGDNALEPAYTGSLIEDFWNCNQCLLLDQISTRPDVSTWILNLAIFQFCQNGTFLNLCMKFKIFFGQKHYFEAL